MSVVVFADGACSGNPGPGGWAALILRPTVSQSEISSLGLWGSASSTTNNVMELTALLKALETLSHEPALELKVALDSTYVLKGCQEWRLGWRKRGWIKSDGSPVANLELWKKLDAMLNARRGPIEWIWVEGHAGILGNEWVDSRAVDACQNQSQGEEALSLESDFLTFEASVAKSKPIYLSLVDGVLKEHTRWSECEARVKGQKGARFKKVSSPQEREKCLKGWGL
jgi:ribonuclease HI